MNQRAFFERCEAIEGAAVGDAVFSDGAAVWAGQTEVAHFHGQSALEVRLTKAVIRERREELRADPRVELRKNASDWLTINVATKADVDDAIALVRDAVAANLPTTKPGPPPSGPDLARRRRFH